MYRLQGKELISCNEVRRNHKQRYLSGNTGGRRAFNLHGARDCSYESPSAYNGSLSNLLKLQWKTMVMTVMQLF